MNLAKFFYLLYPLYWFKNSYQFAIGAFIFYALTSSFSLLNLILGLFALNLSYLIVYAANDIVDYKEDSRSKAVSKRKLISKSPLMTNHASVEELVQFSVVCLVLGLIIGTAINTFFTLSLLFMIFLNMLFFSNPFIKLKNSFLGVFAMIAIQFLKYMSGYLAEGGSIVLNPFVAVILLFLSIFYVAVYKYYKKGFGLKTKQMNTKTFSVINIVFGIAMILLLVFLLSYLKI